ncbi:MAG: YjbF family lipoprotein [Nevskia sp.]|nr:YjbF family lipoprotein [Nevskia sp.]
MNNPQAMDQTGPSRRVLLQSMLGLGLAGCGASPTLDLVGRTLAGKPKTDSGYPLSVAQIRALPYASLGARFGGGGSVVMVLATYDGNDLHWVSADRAILVTRDGRLIQTVGLARDLRATQYVAADPLQQIFRSGSTEAAPKVWRYIDMSNKDAFGVVVESRYSVLGAETISILGTQHQTMRVRERIQVPSWRWSTDNMFWIDQQTGKIRRARQQYCPEVAVIEYEILKPPAAATAPA